MPRRMKSLLVEDDSATRKLMQRWLSDVSDCDIAVDGVEAVDAFSRALGGFTLDHAKSVAV